MTLRAALKHNARYETFHLMNEIFNKYLALFQMNLISDTYPHPKIKQFPVYNKGSQLFHQKPCIYMLHLCISFNNNMM